MKIFLDGFAAIVLFLFFGTLILGFIYTIIELPVVCTVMTFFIALIWSLERFTKD